MALLPPQQRHAAAPASSSCTAVPWPDGSCAAPCNGQPAALTAGTKSPLTWTVADVQQFLASLDLHFLQHLFLEHDVNGMVLLTLTEADLESQLGIHKFGHRRRLALGIAALQAMLPQNLGSRFIAGTPYGDSIDSSMSASLHENTRLPTPKCRPNGMLQVAMSMAAPASMGPRARSMSPVLATGGLRASRESLRPAVLTLRPQPCAVIGAASREPSLQTARCSTQNAGSSWLRPSASQSSLGGSVAQPQHRRHSQPKVRPAALSADVVGQEGVAKEVIRRSSSDLHTSRRLIAPKRRTASTSPLQIRVRPPACEASLAFEVAAGASAAAASAAVSAETAKAAAAAAAAAAATTATATDPLAVPTDVSPRSWAPQGTSTAVVARPAVATRALDREELPVEECRPESWSSRSGRQPAQNRPSSRGPSIVAKANIAGGAEACEKRELSVQELRPESWSERQIAQHRHVRTWLVSRALTGAMGATHDGNRRVVAGTPCDAQILAVAAAVIDMQILAELQGITGVSERLPVVRPYMEFLLREVFDDLNVRVRTRGDGPTEHNARMLVQQLEQELLKRQLLPPDEQPLSPNLV
mmetsp:Transcript_10128/g.19547  ORF Transcript_10128/g.19547 Transcript_10128/m.19547 type:complete len:588 (+) Transcript_10128:33-1796(+)